MPAPWEEAEVSPRRGTWEVRVPDTGTDEISPGAVREPWGTWCRPRPGGWMLGSGGGTVRAAFPRTVPRAAAVFAQRPHKGCPAR